MRGSTGFSHTKTRTSLQFADEEGNKKQDEWIGKAAKEIGLTLEGLTEDQQRTWHAMSTIRQEAEQSGRLAVRVIKGQGRVTIVPNYS